MFAKYALENGGKIVPIILDYKDTEGTGVMNPSIFNDNGNLLLNVRHVNYAIYHCHNFFHEYGPLQYIHREDQRVLKTTNFLMHLRQDLSVAGYAKIDTSELDQEPQWEFIGLEDARLVKWNGKFFLIGVRRDDNPTGKGRMEMSEIDPFTYKEISRHKIPAPGKDDSYCEKNWMPVLNRPFTFVKWTIPTEVVTYDINKQEVKSYVKEQPIKLPADVRGGSQLISYKDYYIAITHEAFNFQSELGQKDAIYNHRFMVWDKNFNLVRTTPSFSFLNGCIEFCTGLCTLNDNALISFGRQDNTAYILQMPLDKLEQYIWKA